MEFYPLFFQPVYKHAIWGGNKLESLLGRTTDTGQNNRKTPVGEAWEIVDREHDQSEVLNGAFAGCSLHSLIRDAGADILGDNASGMKRFPLLVKLIDTAKNLSIQVHPDAAACELCPPGAEPKTEMWYILHSEKNTGIFAGLRDGISIGEVEQHIQADTMADLLQFHSVKRGDLFYVKAGCLHSIGGGILLFEVQENSDTTYRVSDWNRLDSDGKPRKLHIEEALKCIRPDGNRAPKIEKDRPQGKFTRTYSLLNERPDAPFAVNEIKLAGKWHDSTCGSGSEKRAFHILTSLENDVRISCLGTFDAFLPPGASCLIPAALGDYILEPMNSRPASVLKTTLA